MATAPRPTLVGVLHVRLPPALAAQDPAPQGQGRVHAAGYQWQQQQGRLLPAADCQQQCDQDRQQVTQRAAAHVAEEDARSEEHTSELQSLMRISYAVFCLKKKKKQTNNTTHQ